MNSILLPLALTLAGHFDSQTAPSDDVRLIVLVSVDQMIPEQLERLRPAFSGGLARFGEGEVWRRAAHVHSATKTGPGHTTLGTGVYPRHHGIISNDWMKREERGRQYCVADSEAQLIGPEGVIEAEGQGRSPKNLMAPALGDHRANADPMGKSVSVAAKDRAAIGTNGRAGDLVLWWDHGGRGFISSNAYATNLPEFVARWDGNWARNLDLKDGSLVWESRVPEEAAHWGTMPDQRPGEAQIEGSSTFPHLSPSFDLEDLPASVSRLADWIYFTPLVDTFTVAIAKQAVQELELGMDQHVDTLFVGLSACDTTGHTFGPYSEEVTDVILNVDRQLGDLFQLLDERVGQGHWIAALSADHGVLPLPEQRLLNGQVGQRVSGKDVADALRALRSAITERYAEGVMVGSARNRLRLSAKAMQEGGFDPQEVRAFAAEFLTVEVPDLARVFTLDELLAVPDDAPFGTDPLKILMARSTLAGRSPDVVWIRPQGVIEMRRGTTHGSPYFYDRHVPLAFIGPGSTPGERWDQARTVDVLPTLFSRARLPVPEGLDGRVLK